MARRPQSRTTQTGDESRIAEIVGSQKALFTGLFDGATDEVPFERSGSFFSRIERIVARAAQQALAAIAAPEDEAAEREIAAVVGAAGDESREGPAT